MSWKKNLSKNYKLPSNVKWSNKYQAFLTKEMEEILDSQAAKEINPYDQKILDKKKEVENKDE